MNSLAPEGLSSILAGAGIEVSHEAAGKLARHAGEMLLWNRSIRLTSITAHEDIAVKHIVDSLKLLLFSPFPGRTLDFGSGAGYPGIPLAVAAPEARLVLLESSGKKCAFLSRVCSMLALGNVEVVNGRLDARLRSSLGSFEHIVTRATLPPAEAARLLVPMLAPGGRLLLMTGPGEFGSPARKGGGGSQGPEAALPHGAVLRRFERFSLPLGKGLREIREICAKDQGRS